MSLDNIQLTPNIIADFFKNCLVDIETHQQKNEISNISKIAYLGNNKKNICIIVNEPNAIYLEENNLSFLITILSACNLTIEDISIVNFAKKRFTYNEIYEQLESTTVFMFGVTPAELSMPLDFPVYQLQKYNGQQYLHAPELTKLIDDKSEKTKLWLLLQQIFHLTKK